MWTLTAAQRALMLGPDQTSKGHRKPRIMSRDELTKLAATGDKKRAETNGTSGA